MLAELIDDEAQRNPQITIDLRRIVSGLADYSALGCAHASASSTAAVDPERLEQELALLVQRADVTEELDRLDIHIVEARKNLAGDGPHGRHLDFLLQELNREANTLASKSMLAESSAARGRSEGHHRADPRTGAEHRMTGGYADSGLLIVVSAPSGAGKTSLVNALVSQRPKHHRVGVAYHTGAARQRARRG